MTFKVINNPDFKKNKDPQGAGFKNHEFKQLSGLFHYGASHKVLYDIAVDVDFDESKAIFTYYRSKMYQPYLQFVVAHVGPRTVMYELYKEGQGRIAKSGLFTRILDKLREEIDILIDA